MNNTQLLQELDQQLSKINAQREAHVEIQQIMDFYKQKVASNQPPATSNQQPATSNQSRATSNQQPEKL